MTAMTTRLLVRYCQVFGKDLHHAKKTWKKMTLEQQGVARADLVRRLNEADILLATIK